MPTPFVPGRDPKKRRREERTRKHPKVIPSPYLDFLTHAPTTIIPVVRISRRRSLSEFVRVVELPLMTWHRWELPLPASVVAVNRVRQSRLIRRYLTRKLL